jgi:hypothetical protein
MTPQRNTDVRGLFDEQRAVVRLCGAWACIHRSNNFYGAHLGECPNRQKLCRLPDYSDFSRIFAAGQGIADYPVGMV